MVIIQDFHTLSPNIQNDAITLLANEFYGTRRLTKGIQAFQDSIAKKQEFAKCLLVDSTLVGITTYRIFDWERLSPQLYLQAHYENNRLVKIRLQHFHRLLAHVELDYVYNQAIELAYTVVKQSYRGRGFGTQLYIARLQELTRLPNPDATLLFTIARSAYAGTGTKQKLVNELLEKEKQVYGTRGDGQINVQGLWVDVYDLSRDIEIDITSLTPVSGAEAIVHLASKYKLNFMGFSTNLSPVFGAKLSSTIQYLPK